MSKAPNSSFKSVTIYIFFFFVTSQKIFSYRYNLSKFTFQNLLSAIQILQLHHDCATHIGPSRGSVLPHSSQHNEHLVELPKYLASHQT